MGLPSDPGLKASVPFTLHVRMGAPCRGLPYPFLGRRQRPMPRVFTTGLGLRPDGWLGCRPGAATHGQGQACEVGATQRSQAHPRNMYVLECVPPAGAPAGGRAPGLVSAPCQASSQSAGGPCPVAVTATGSTRSARARLKSLSVALPFGPRRGALGSWKFCPSTGPCLHPRADEFLWLNGE